jgi:hypothetical protein
VYDTSGILAMVVFCQGPLIAYVRDGDISIEFMLTGDVAQYVGIRHCRATTPSGILHSILNVDHPKCKVAIWLRSQLNIRLSHEFGNVCCQTIRSLVIRIRRLADIGHSDRLADIFRDVHLISIPVTLTLCGECDELHETPDCPFHTSVDN